MNKHTRARTNSFGRHGETFVVVLTALHSIQRIGGTLRRGGADDSHVSSIASSHTRVLGLLVRHYRRESVNKAIRVKYEDQTQSIVVGIIQAVGNSVHWVANSVARSGVVSSAGSNRESLNDREEGMNKPTSEYQTVIATGAGAGLLF